MAPRYAGLFLKRKKQILKILLRYPPAPIRGFHCTGCIKLLQHCDVFVVTSIPIGRVIIFSRVSQCLQYFGGAKVIEVLLSQALEKEMDAVAAACGLNNPYVLVIAF